MPSSTSRRFRIVTRTSALALWQAEHVRRQLMHHHDELDIEIIGVKTSGDLSQTENIPLYKVGGKSLFVKELEHALLQEEADIAVHSLKDVPAFFPQGLTLGAICERENPFDAWVCPKGFTFATLPSGSKVGTSSLRRMMQLKALRPDLNFVSLRGNVDTRLRKCESGEFDAIILAVAGLVRLNLQQHIISIFSPQEMIPAVGQGALGIECRKDDEITKKRLQVLNHLPTQRCIEAERAMNAALGGNCQVPVAGFAELRDNLITLQGKVGSPESGLILHAQRSATIEEAVHLGQQVAEDLIKQGAKEIIAKVMRND